MAGSDEKTTTETTTEEQSQPVEAEVTEPANDEVLGEGEAVDPVEAGKADAATNADAEQVKDDELNSSDDKPAAE
jgi:hypothetical protein